LAPDPDHGITLAPSVAPGLGEVGMMLPYTPLQHVLMAAVRGPLVMTSGNLSDEPIAMDNGEALRRLAPLADGFLMNDRGIYSRYDDSVMRVVGEHVESVRRARGYAPFPLRLPESLTGGADGSGMPQVLAAGPEQKNTFCLTSGKYAFVSQHIGELENADALEHYEATLALYERLFRVEPRLVAYDLHPEYLSTKFALGLGLPSVGVQHHHAHIASVTAEHGVPDTVVGIAYDGTGYGEDGTIWGGEVLLSTWTGYTRFAHLRPVPMPGGAAAIRRPGRMALGLLFGLDRGLLEHPGAHHLVGRLTTDELTKLPMMVDQGINSPLTSSMGRLFDAVAALTGVRTDSLYEGQAAIELEALADPCETGAYTFGLLDTTPLVIDPLPVVEGILDDMARGEAVTAISAKFHRAVVDMTVEVALRAADAAGTRTVAAAGGVFMNRLVLAGVAQGIRDAGLTALSHRELPANDGGVSFGQAVVALARSLTV
ncbi:MAG TPA: Sua5/YciO/YrdC/YwlC family protein, partial [Coriobacteriia bacterium]